MINSANTAQIRAEFSGSPAAAGDGRALRDGLQLDGPGVHGLGDGQREHDGQWQSAGGQRRRALELGHGCKRLPVKSPRYLR